MKKKEIEGKFTAHQVKALPLLLIYSNATVARELGVSESAIYSWLRGSKFKAELDRLRAETFDESLQRVRSAAALAVDRLVALLDSEDSQIVCRAASKILDTSIKLKELFDVEERLAALEQAVSQ